MSDRSPGPVDPFLGGFAKYVNDVRGVESQGVKWIALVCGFWYEYSLGMGEAWLGFNLKDRKVVMYDQGEKRVNVSTWGFCGAAIAKLFSLPLESDGEGVSLKHFENKGLYVSSFLISQRDILESLHRVLGTKDADWKIEYQAVEERHKEGMGELADGNRLGFAKALYAKIFEKDGRGDYETGHGLDNEKLKLEKENLDEATKRAVGMVEGGFGWKG